MNDKVTIVTVTYNAEDLLEETILSVINQSYDNIEYIIIDGASTDGTLDIIKKYEDHIDYWVSEPDGGIYYAMNKAIKKATGEWINFMNAGDTFFDNETVAYVMEHKCDDAELIYGNYYQKIAKREIKALEQSKWFTTMPFNHQTLFTKTEIMRKNPFDTSYKIVADLNFIYQMTVSKKKFNYIDKIIAIFVEGGFANSNTVEMCLESFRSQLENNVDIKNIYNSSWYRHLLSLSEYRDKLIFSDLFMRHIQNLNNDLSELNHAEIVIQRSGFDVIATLNTPYSNTQVAFYLYKDDKHIDTQWYSKDATYRLDHKKVGSGRYRVRYFVVDGNEDDPGNAKKLDSGFSDYIEL